MAESLRSGGHTVALFEGDKSLLSALERFMPPAHATGQPTGLALNMAYGIQGESRYTHVPAMLELAGVPYTGAAPLGHAVSLDKAVAKALLVAAGVPTPRFALMDHGQAPRPGLRFPLIVKPRHESTSFGLELVYDDDQLGAAVDTVVTRFEQPALIEEYIDGRELCIGLLGNERLETLPAVELGFQDRTLRLVTYDDKYHRRSDEPQKLCPAALPARLARQVDQIARATFRTCHARDYARVDIRIDQLGRPFVLELNSMASLGRRGSFVHAANVAGTTSSTGSSRSRRNDASAALHPPRWERTPTQRQTQQRLFRLQPLPHADRWPDRAEAQPTAEANSAEPPSVRGRANRPPKTPRQQAATLQAGSRGLPIGRALWIGPPG